MISKFIKYLLAYTPLPVYPTISTDDIVIEGCTYIYKYMILKCTRTGLFKGIKSNQEVIDHLYVNEYVQTTDDDHVVRHPVIKYNENKPVMTLIGFILRMKATKMVSLESVA